MVILVSLKTIFVATVSPVKPLQTILQLGLWAAADNLEYHLSFALISRCNAPLLVALVSPKAVYWWPLTMRQLKSCRTLDCGAIRWERICHNSWYH